MCNSVSIKNWKENRIERNSLSKFIGVVCLPLNFFAAPDFRHTWALIVEQSAYEVQSKLIDSLCVRSVMSHFNLRFHFDAYFAFVLWSLKLHNRNDKHQWQTIRVSLMKLKYSKRKKKKLKKSSIVSRGSSTSRCGDGRDDDGGGSTDSTRNSSYKIEFAQYTSLRQSLSKSIDTLRAIDL